MVIKIINFRDFQHLESNRKSNKQNRKKNRSLQSLAQCKEAFKGPRP